MPDLPATYVAGQLGHLADHADIAAMLSGPVTYLVPGDSIAAGVAKAAADKFTYGASTLRFLGTHVAGVNEVFSIPAGVDVNMRGGTLKVRGAAGQLGFDNADSTYFLRVNGNNEAVLPLRIGTGAGGAGGKCLFEGIYVTQVGAGGTCCRIDNLQNSTILNYRHTNVDLAVLGLVIDNGCKNLYFFSSFPTHCGLGPDVLITTSGGTQRTSKIVFYAGLTELEPGGTGWRLEDCDDIVIRDFAMNGGGNAGASILCVAGGNRGGSPHGPASITIDNVQFKSRPIVLQVDTGATEVHIESCSGQFMGTLYQINNPSVRVYERRHFGTFWTTKFATTGGAVEATCILPG